MTTIVFPEILVNICCEPSHLARMLREKVVDCKKTARVIRQQMDPVALPTVEQRIARSRAHDEARASR
jgi:hypothetical protein